MDVHSLLMVLERLPTRLQCPECGTKAISIAWEVPTAPEPSQTSPAKLAARISRPQGGERRGLSTGWVSSYIFAFNACIANTRRM